MRAKFAVRYCAMTPLQCHDAHSKTSAVLEDIIGLFFAPSFDASTAYSFLAAPDFADITPIERRYATMKSGRLARYAPYRRLCSTSSTMTTRRAVYSRSTELLRQHAARHMASTDAT